MIIVCDVYTNAHACIYIYIYTHTQACVRACVVYLWVDQLLAVVDDPPGCDTERQHLIGGGRGGGGGVVPDRLPHTSAHPLLEAGGQDPRTWSTGGG